MSRLRFNLVSVLQYVIPFTGPCYAGTELYSAVIPSYGKHNIPWYATSVDICRAPLIVVNSQQTHNVIDT